jgi:hypothetical protein
MAQMRWLFFACIQLADKLGGHYTWHVLAGLPEAAALLVPHVLTMLTCNHMLLTCHPLC